MAYNDVPLATDLISDSQAEIRENFQLIQNLNFDTEFFSSGVQRNLKNKLEEVASVKDYGAIGDGTNDDTNAIQACIDENKYVFIPTPDDYYKISDTISMNCRKLFGVGLEGHLYITSDDLPILQVTGTKKIIHGLWLEYANNQTGNTRSNGIEFYKDTYRCDIRNIRIERSYRGLYQAQGENGETSSSFFSNNIENIYVAGYKAAVMHIYPYNGGNTGNVFTNINSHAEKGGYNGEVSSIPVIIGQKSGLINQLNIEDVKNAGTLLRVTFNHNTTINALHIEGSVKTQDLQPIIELKESCRLNINDITMVNNDFSQIADDEKFYVFQMEDNCSINISGIYDRNNTFNTNADNKLIRYTGTDGLTSYFNGHNIKLTDNIDIRSNDNDIRISHNMERLEREYITMDRTLLKPQSSQPTGYDGMIAYSDGSWGGSGEGFYGYVNGSWTKL